VATDPDTMSRRLFACAAGCVAIFCLTVAVAVAVVLAMRALGWV
jgi:hypothetical protein